MSAKKKGSISKEWEVISRAQLASDEKNFWCDWKEYKTKSEEEIEKDLSALKKQHKSFNFIEEYLSTTWQINSKLSHIILLYLPIRTDRKNELIEHFDIPPLAKESVTEIQTRARENITRFLNITETKGMLSPHKIENPIQMLDYYVYEIYWYRMGIQRFKDGYPNQPSDILGILRNNNWFYYKDGHPHFYSKTTHRQWICLTGNSLKELLLKMDYRDVNNFIYNYTKWSPMDIKRCGCSQCKKYYHNDGRPKKLSLLLTSSLYEFDDSFSDLRQRKNDKRYKHGNELNVSLIGGKSSTAKSSNCCSCIVL